MEYFCAAVLKVLYLCADATVDEQLMPSKSIVIDQPIKYEIKIYFQTCNAVKYNHLNGCIS